MNTLVFFLIGFIALLHLGILVLEMFLWTKPIGLKIFRQSVESAKNTSALAANQGLYNGFLAAGLIWSLIHPNPEFCVQLSLFFLSCVFIAGAYGGYSVSKRIFYIQSLPAIVAILLISLF